MFICLLRFGSFQPLFPQISSLHLSLSSPARTPIMHILVYLLVSHKSLRFSLCFHLFFCLFASLTWWFQMTYLQVCWLFLPPDQIWCLTPLMSCFSSFIVFFSFITFISVFFIVSISSLIFSCCSWIIFLIQGWFLKFYFVSLIGPCFPVSL